MPQDALGRVALLVLILVLMYNSIFALVKASFSFISNTVSQGLGILDKMAIQYGGGQPVYPETESLLSSIFSWTTFVFTNSLAFAVIIFIDMVKMAMGRSG